MKYKILNCVRLFENLQIIIKGISMNFFKTIGLLFLAIFSASLMIACSQDKSDVEETTQMTLSNTAAKASMDKETEADSKVYKIADVMDPVQGMSVDFSWNENGQRKTFYELIKGKVVLLNFWGTWCPPCRKEIPDLIKINDELKDKDFIMIGIALERDVTTALKKVESFAKSQKMDYYQFVDETREIVEAYGGINAVPTTFIIDKKGKIVETIVGMRDHQGFIDAINRAF